MPYFYFNPWGENIFNVLRVETRESEKLSVKICNYSLCSFLIADSNLFLLILVLLIITTLFLTESLIA